MRIARRAVRRGEAVSSAKTPPKWIRPQLAKLVDKVPAGDDWAHEIKLDGYRMAARIEGGAATLLTRTGLDWTAKYSRIAAALGALDCRTAYIDGELCAVDIDGMTSFAALQAASGVAANLVYFAFDLLHLDGDDLMALPLLERKDRLEALLKGPPMAVRFNEHIIGNGPRVLEVAAKLKVEGVVSKRVDEPYLPDNRCAWVKTKCLNRQEFVVAGWTDPEGARASIGALLLGYYDEAGKLIYAGRVGTGMTQGELAAWPKMLAPLAVERITVDQPPPRDSRFGRPLELSRVHWVRPELVVEVTFLTWTADGLLRQVVYEGLREDKPARDVRRE